METQTSKPVGSQPFIAQKQTTSVLPKKSEETKTKRKKNTYGNFPRSSIKRLIVATGMRTQPEVITVVESYIVKVTKDVAEECKKLAVEDKRSTIYAKDIEKVLKFKPYCDI